MAKYKLICMSFDGEYKTENNHGENFASIEDAWKYSNDMGSRWYFYPFYFVVTESGLTIADSFYGCGFLKGKRVSTVEKIFERVSKQENAKNVTCFEFVFLLNRYFQEVEDVL